LTRAVGFDVADPVPPAFDAVTVARMYRLRSADVGEYVFAVAPEIGTHDEGAVVEQRRHW
jgi:hypothetical protein